MSRQKVILLVCKDMRLRLSHAYALLKCASLYCVCRGEPVAEHARLRPHRLLPASVADWTVPDVQEWLELIGMAQYADVFEMTGIDGVVLSNGLNDTTLDMLLVSDQSHRQQLRNALRTQLLTTPV
jgi:hypothetical protein